MAGGARNPGTDDVLDGPRDETAPGASAAEPMLSDERSELLGGFAERMFDVVRKLRRQLTTPHEGLIHVNNSEAEIMRITTSLPGVTVGEIARNVGLHKSNTSTTIATLVEKGLLEKRPAPDDAREVRIYPTDLAGRNLDGYRAVWAEQLGPATDATDEQLRAALALLDGIDERLGGGSWPVIRPASPRD